MNWRRVQDWCRVEKLWAQTIFHLRSWSDCILLFADTSQYVQLFKEEVFHKKWKKLRPGNIREMWTVYRPSCMLDTTMSSSGHSQWKSVQQTIWVLDIWSTVPAAEETVKNIPCSLAGSTSVILLRILDVINMFNSATWCDLLGTQNTFLGFHRIFPRWWKVTCVIRC